MAKKTTTVKKITVNQNVRSDRIIPVEGDDCSSKHSRRWKGATVAFSLTKDEAIHLARVLLAGTQEWDKLWITAWRNQKRKNDGTYPVTVTSEVQESD